MTVPTPLTVVHQVRIAVTIAPLPRGPRGGANRSRFRIRKKSSFGSGVELPSALTGEPWQPLVLHDGFVFQSITSWSVCAYASETKSAAAANNAALASDMHRFLIDWITFTPSPSRS